MNPFRPVGTGVRRKGENEKSLFGGKIRTVASSLFVVKRGGI